MKNRIRILATSDIHGNVDGFAGISTLVSYLKDENTILLDNGDSITGSELSEYHHRNHPGEVSPFTRIMNHMEYDYVNIGNHEYDYGEEALQAHINALDMPVITSNVSVAGKPLGANYVVRQIEGKKIAIIAVTSQCVPVTTVKENIKHTRFFDAYEKVKKSLEYVRTLEKPDYVIVLYHGGFERNLVNGVYTEEPTGNNQGYMMLKDLNFDVLIAGHQHISSHGKAFGTSYIQPAAHGRELACVDIYTDTNIIETTLYHNDADQDPEILNYAAEEMKETEAWLDTVIGTTYMDLKVKASQEPFIHKSQLVTLINQIYLEASHADIAATGIGFRKAGFSGTITIRDVYRLFGIPNHLTVKKINGKILREYLEKAAEFWTVSAEQVVIHPRYLKPVNQLFNYAMVDGIEYTIKASNPFGERITALTYKGQEVTDDMEFAIAMNSYAAAGGGDYLMMKQTQTLKQFRETTMDLVIRYIKNHPNLSVEPVNNITIEK